MSYEQRARVDAPDGRRPSDADFVDGFVAVYVDHEPWKDAARKQLSERLASIAAEARATAIEEAALRCIRRLAVLKKHFGEDDPRVEGAREFELTSAALDIRALSPRPDVRLVAREDLATVIEAAAELEQRIRAERAGYDVSRAEEIRAAIDRLRAGEEE